MDTFNLWENFITPAEQREIIAWALTRKADMHDHSDYLHSGGPGQRLAGTIAGLSFERSPPKIIGELGHRMEETLGMKRGTRLQYKLVIHEQGADTQNHVDAYSSQYPNFFRAALLVKKATRGGIFQVGDMDIEFPERSLLQFLGATEHGVTEVTRGQRILLRANWGWEA